MMVATDEQQSAMTRTGATFYTIEQVAARTGLTKRTLRYYEEIGLLPPAGRTEGNYRRYTDEDIERLERIKKLRDLLGFSLNDIRALLEADDERVQLKATYQQLTTTEQKLDHLDRVDALIRRQLELIEKKLEGLEQMRSALVARLQSHERFRSELLQQQQQEQIE
jgi:DNA-binding transcriptional MerR regulator